MKKRTKSNKKYTKEDLSYFKKIIDTLYKLRFSKFDEDIELYRSMYSTVNLNLWHRFTRRCCYHYRLLKQEYDPVIYHIITNHRMEKRVFELTRNEIIEKWKI